ncbi:hypothetical protein IGI04_025780 [Brassica rapa subsp. trilocularis]|uniref:Uncharacterized protein n=1 Tax=Brassica rapa subsp. trilocularis TaxID=1813537 RepID=A0ABQ7KY11_BRACM|nr:hypothetical protein IGI04_025780 [Brassica rapa subsp. trilocularis]
MSFTERTDSKGDGEFHQQKLVSSVERFDLQGFFLSSRSSLIYMHATKLGYFWKSRPYFF